MPHELRDALRWLGANPGFTAAAGLVLSLSIGASTATFSVVYGVVLRPLSLAAPDRLVRIWSSHPERNLAAFSVSAADFADWRARSRVLTLMAAYEGPRSMVLADGREHELVTTSRVSADMFALLGVRPALGRFPSAAEFRPGAERVAVIAYGLWQRRYGGRSGVLGRTLVLDEEPWTIVGVAPRELEFPNNAADVWLPMQVVLETTSRANRHLRILGRLGEGASVDDARGELAHIARDLAAEYPASNRGWSTNIRPLAETVVSPGMRQALVVLLGAVGLVLLVACANVAGLLMSRAGARRREMGVRTALGATRVALVRQMLLESVLLASASGLAGVVLAMWCVEGLERLAANMIPRVEDVALSGPVVAAAVAASGLTALVFGLVPALTVTRRAIDAVRSTRDSTGRPGDSRSRDVLVLAEVALAVVLLVGAGLLTRSFVRLQTRAVGFDPDRLLIVELAAADRPGRAEDRASRSDELQARLAALPGIEAAAAVSSAPFAGRNSGNVFTIPGRPTLPGDAPDTDFRVVTPSYLGTMGIPLIRGRGLVETDGPGAPAVVISATAARRYWPDTDPIGTSIQFGGLTPEIVGIAADARYGAIDAPDAELRPMMYLPHRLMPQVPLTMVLRALGEPRDIAPAVAATAKAVAPRTPVARLALMSELLGEARAPQQFSATVLGAFAWIAVILAGAGLWGLIAYTVARRTREIGIRVALGAGPRHVVGMAAGRGLVLGLAGLGLGLAAAASLSGVLGRLLFGVSPTDRATFGAIAAILLCVVVAASLLPARRALRIDPAEALRLE